MLLLAECSAENGNFENALMDIRECIALQQSIFEDIDRRIANSCFYEGLIHAMSKQPLAAIESFTKAKKILEKRLGKSTIVILSYGKSTLSLRVCLM